LEEGKRERGKERKRERGFREWLLFRARILLYIGRGNKGLGNGYCLGLG